MDYETEYNKRKQCIFGIRDIHSVIECNKFKQKTERKDFEPRKQKVLSFGDVPRNQKKGIGLGA